MSRPTEPGYYWLQSLGAWEVVRVGLIEEDGSFMTIRSPNFAWPVYFFSDNYEARVANYADHQWGSKITQKPAVSPQNASTDIQGQTAL